MKNLMILIAVLMTANFAACGQKTDVPEKVKAAFTQKVQNAKDVEWEFDKEDALWEAEYKIGKVEYTSAFTENGEWKETETSIAMKDIPPAISTMLESDYTGYEIDGAEYVENPEGEFYEVELEMEKDGKETEVELLITKEGKVVKKVDEDEDEDED